MFSNWCQHFYWSKFYPIRARFWRVLLGCIINAERHIPPKTMHITSIERSIPFHWVDSSSSTSWEYLLNKLFQLFKNEAQKHNWGQIQLKTAHFESKFSATFWVRKFFQKWVLISILFSLIPPHYWSYPWSFHECPLRWVALWSKFSF